MKLKWSLSLVCVLFLYIELFMKPCIMCMDCIHMQCTLVHLYIHQYIATEGTNRTAYDMYSMITLSIISEKNITKNEWILSKTISIRLPLRASAIGWSLSIQNIYFDSIISNAIKYENTKRWINNINGKPWNMEHYSLYLLFRWWQHGWHDQYIHIFYLYINNTRGILKQFRKYDP